MLRKGDKFKLIFVLLLVSLVPTAIAMEEEGCVFELDNTEYLLDDVAFATITCDKYIGELYVIAWTNRVQGIVKEDIGVIVKNVTYQSYLQIDNVHGGEVIAYIPNQAEYKRIYTVVDKDRYFYFSLGENDDGTKTEKKFKMLNIGKIIAGEKVSETVGWIVIVVFIWLGYAIIISGPDLIKKRLERRVK